MEGASASSKSGQSKSDDELLKLAAERLREKKGPSSKYDYIKIKVWLGEGQQHYYILSRFLISRILTVTKVPPDKAIKIALEVKKWLVDNDKLNLTQPELEAVLFNSMRSRGFGDECIQRFRMMNEFQQQKRPLIILICGAPCSGKSSLAQQLASRLNLPNVLQTDVLKELLQGEDGAAPLPMEPLWARKELFSSSELLISAFREESKIMRRALDGDLVKCISDGKSIIIEGLHLDPGLYLEEFCSGEISRKMTVELGNLPSPNSILMERKLGEMTLNSCSFSSGDSYGEPEDSNSNSSSSKDAAPTTTKAMTRTLSRSESISKGLKTYGEPIVVPIVLRLDPDDYPVIAEDWLLQQEHHRLSSSLSSNASTKKEEGYILNRVLVLQEYLGSYSGKGALVMDTSILKFEEAVDRCHDYVLSSIEKAMKRSHNGRMMALLNDI